MKKRWKVGVAGLIIVGALGYLGYQGFVSSAATNVNVGELLAGDASFVGENVRLGGTVAPGSIQQSGRNLRFSITDGERSVLVVYEGVVPDSFRAGGEILVEGTLDETGSFAASALLPKCASKYQSE